jgi:hypothetical protein
MEAEMVRLTMIIFAMAGTTLSGIGVVVILSANMGTAQNIIVAAALGAVLALPLSWVVAKQIAQ